jgi:nitrogen fixation NifU-like protein
MDRQEAIDRLLEHYQNPRNYGPNPAADVVMPGGNPGCGDVITIYLQVANACIERVTFEGHGCTVSQAGASILSELVIGKTFAELDDFDNNDMMFLLGRDIVATRPRCASLALNTLKAAIHHYRHHTPSE